VWRFHQALRASQRPAQIMGRHASIDWAAHRFEIPRYKI
jgi:hypothetical protein